VIAATVNEATPLQLLAADGRTDLFGQVRVYSAAGSLVTTINMTHVAEGLYTASWTPATEGWYAAVLQFYTDAGHTTPANYDKLGEQVGVTSMKTHIERVLGLQKENSVLDNIVYDGDGHATSSRLRCYDSKANALLAGSGGLLFQYTITATYSGGILVQYEITREQ
jgi:hypothetical protein